MEAEEILKRFGGVPHRRKKSYSKSSRKFSVSQKTRKLLGLIALLLMTGAVFGTSYLIQNTTLFDRSSAAGESVEGKLNAFVVSDYSSGVSFTEYYIGDTGDAAVRVDSKMVKNVGLGKRLRVDNISKDATNKIASGDLSILANTEIEIDNNRRYLFILLNYSDLQHGDSSAQAIITGLNNYESSVSEYFSNVSYGNAVINYDVFPAVVQSTQSHVKEGDPYYSCIGQHMLNTALEAFLVSNSQYNVDINSYDGVGIITPAGVCGFFGTGIGPLGKVSANVNGVNYSFYVVQLIGPYVSAEGEDGLVHIITHEMQHNFGLLHSNWLACKLGTYFQDENVCKEQPAQNYFSNMGYGTAYAIGLDAGELDNIGWITVPEVNETGTYLLDPLSVGPHARTIKIPRRQLEGGRTEYLYISLRNQSGIDQNLPDSVNSGVLITSGPDSLVLEDGTFVGSSMLLLDSTPLVSGDLNLISIPADILNAPFKPGDTFIDPLSGTGIVVNYDVNAQQYSVYVNLLSEQSSSYRGTQGTYDEFVDDGTAQGETL